MKKIKAVVLKDATKLTNSQMKEIRGGYEPEKNSSVCSTACPDGITLGWFDCNSVFTGSICQSSTNGNVICYHPLYGSPIEQQACPDAPPTK